MEVLTRLLFLGLLICPGFAADRRRRSKICGGDCMWLDELKQKKQLPLQAFISPYDIHTYCSEGLDKHTPWWYLHSWSAMYVTISANPTDGINVADGNSSTAVTEKLKEGLCLPPSSTSTELAFSIYNISCVGVRHSHTNDDTVWYMIDAKEGLIPLYPALFGLGVVLLFITPSLSRSKTLYYGTGITIAVLVSVLILLCVVSKFIPEKNLFGLGLLASDDTFSVSFFYWLANNAVEFALTNWQYVVAYVCLAALISFAVLYRICPADPRSLDLLQWTVQLVAMVMLFFASPHVEVSVGLMVTALLLYWIPYRSILHWRETEGGPALRNLVTR